MSKNQDSYKAIIGGHLIQSFNSMIYGFLAVMLAPIFFPGSSPLVGILASYGAFAAGFIARPLGAMWFGSLGDKQGRNKPLIISMTLIGIPTLAIGITPSYETIGILAPIILILCRIAQGVFTGGEFTSVLLYIYENQMKGTLGFNTGLLMSSARVGAVLAVGLSALVTMHLVPTWMWRIPFIVGGLAAFCVWFFLKETSETEEFVKTKQQGNQLVSPWKEVFSYHKKPFIVACLLKGLTIMPSYLATIFGNRLFIEFGFSNAECMLLNMFSLVLDGILIVFFGLLADKIGFRFQTILGSILIALLAFPAFYFISGENVGLFQVLFFIAWLTSSGSVLNGCAMTYTTNFFPIHCRFTGGALSLTIGFTLFGATSPLMGSFLMDLTNNRMAPAFWLAAIAIITVISTYYFKVKET